MSVWMCDEKLLIFASLISPSKMILFEKKYQTFDTVFHPVSYTHLRAVLSFALSFVFFSEYKLRLVLGHGKVMLVV